jgi:hypothetical protein
MKQPMRLKSGGFMSSGTDAGDLKILRTAKNIDDGSANGMKKGGKLKRKLTPKEKDKYKASLAYQIKTGRTNKKKGEDLVDKIKKGYEFTTKTAPRRAAQVALGDPIAKRKYGAGDVFNQFTEKATRMKSGGVAQRQKKMNEIRKQAIEAYKDPNKRLSKNLRMHMERFKSRNKADATKMKEGGKTKSRVNEAGNYTKPGLRKRIFNRIKAGGKGGRPGQWSARKAQMMAKAYKKAGGGYK